MTVAVFTVNLFNISISCILFCHFHCHFATRQQPNGSAIIIFVYEHRKGRYSERETPVDMPEICFDSRPTETPPCSRFRFTDDFSEELKSEMITEGEYTYVTAVN